LKRNRDTEEDQEDNDQDFVPGEEEAAETEDEVEPEVQADEDPPPPEEEVQADEEVEVVLEELNNLTVSTVKMQLNLPCLVYTYIGPDGCERVAIDMLMLSGTRKEDLKPEFIKGGKKLKITQTLPDVFFSPFRIIGDTSCGVPVTTTHSKFVSMQKKCNSVKAAANHEGVKGSFTIILPIQVEEFFLGNMRDGGSGLEVVVMEHEDNDFVNHMQYYYILQVELIGLKKPHAKANIAGADFFNVRKNPARSPPPTPTGSNQQNAAQQAAAQQAAAQQAAAQQAAAQQQQQRYEQQQRQEAERRQHNENERRRREHQQEQELERQHREFLRQQEAEVLRQQQHGGQDEHKTDFDIIED
jgi:hypothetical protein